MAPTATYVLDSDKEVQETRSQSLNGTNQSKGVKTKRAWSKSPARSSGKRARIEKEANKRGKPGTSSSSKTPKSKPKAKAKKSPKSKAKKTNSSLTVEEAYEQNSMSRQSTIEMRQSRDPKKELKAAIKRIKKSKSRVYEFFKLLKLKKPPKPGMRFRFYEFCCITCGEVITREIGDGSTSSVLKHHNACQLRKHRTQGKLVDYGISGGGAPQSKFQVRKYVALWICKDGRLFVIINDHYLRKLFPCEIADMLPSRSTIAKDISTIYRMTQKTIKTMLGSVVGVFHIALDLYQAPNGFDYLGLVVFHPKVMNNTIEVKRFVLECLSFPSKHTGIALANVVHQILCKFGIQDRVLGIVCDNASNNNDMMKRFKRFKLKRLVGPEVCVHCLPHILNLASKAIAAPFLKKRAEMDRDPRADDRDDGFSDLSLDGEEDQDGQEDGQNEDYDPNAEDETGEDDGTAPLHTLDFDDEEFDEDLVDVELPEMIPGSREAKELKAITKALYKMGWLSNWLRFYPRFKQEFLELCAHLKASYPHNIPQDARM